MDVLFYIHALFAIIAMAFAMTLKHTVHALLSMIASLLFLAVALYILSAPVAAGLLVVVYAGAIMVLFAFAIMLLQIPVNEDGGKSSKSSLLKAAVIFALFWGELTLVTRSFAFTPQAAPPGMKEVAQALFLKYGFLVELASMLLLAGLCAAIYVGAHFMAADRRVELNDL